MSVFDKANELAEAINQSTEYKNLIDCKCKLDKDEEATTLLRDMVIMQEEYVKTLRENIEKDAVKSMENLLKNKHQELLDNKITYGYIKAKDVFDQLMKEVNKTLAKGIELKTKQSDCDSCEGCQ